MEKIVLSASRRTDIPAFYMKDFMHGIRNGSFEVANPFNGNIRVVNACPEKVHSIVFWSKNYGPFLDGCYQKTLTTLGYRLFFQFTLNSPSVILEPHIPPLAERLKQMKTLCDTFGTDAVNWRFDPICFFTLGSGEKTNNLLAFDQIAAEVSAMGIKSCTTSFLDHYPKIIKRTDKEKGIRFIDPSETEKVNLILNLAKRLKSLNINLNLCCEKIIHDRLPLFSGVNESACIDGKQLKKLYGNSISLKRDYGQRRKDGCGCTVSADVGSYAKQPCYHDCLYCYANPNPWLKKPQGRIAH